MTSFATSNRAIVEYPEFVGADAAVEPSSARAASPIRTISERNARPIEEATQDIIAGNVLGQFVVEIIQGGAGTSTNISVYEVIATRAP